MKRVGVRGEWRREGAILLIREGEAYSAMRVKFELWEVGMEMDGDGSRVGYY